MPVKRRVTKRKTELPEGGWKWLRGEDRCGFWAYIRDEGPLAEVWAEYGAEIIAEHVAEHPGTRPRRWWEYDAPRSPIGTYPGLWLDGQLEEPRRRLGGIGTPAHECMAHAPSFSFGIPAAWVTIKDVRWWREDRKRVTGKDGSLRGVAIDPDHPPLFESQAAYLERHGLLLPGERRRLRARDYEPEHVLP